MDDPRSVLALRQAMAGVLADCRPGRRVIVACSGGADSMALVYALSWEAPKAAVVPSAIIVDHGILPTSAGVATQVKSWVGEFMPVEIVTLKDQDGPGGPEGSARSRRYAAIAEHASQWDDPLVLLGHTRDDQAETVLLGLSRGSGLRSIAGMVPHGTLPGHDVACARPFLGISRDQITTALYTWKQMWWEDPSNRTDGPWRQASGAPLVRSAIRHDALPALSTALGSDVRPALARTAELVRVDLDYLDEVAGEKLAEARSGDELDAHVVDACHEAIASRVVRLWLLERGARHGELTRTHIDGVRTLKAGQTRDVPGLCVTRTGTRFAAVLR